MSTLLEALSDGSFDMQNKRDLSTGFARNLTSLRDQVVNDYVKHKIDLNKSIYNLAKSKKLNDDQIKRIVEEVNNQVYLIEYSKMKEQPERHVTFDIAMFPKIKKMIDGNFEENESNKNIQKSASELGSFEKVASDQTAGDSRNLFNSYNVNRCSLKFESSEREDKFHLRKIAENIVNEGNAIEKIAKELDRNLNTMGMAMVKYTQLGLDSNSIFNEMCKKASVDEMTVGLIKEATKTRLDNLKEISPLPTNFNIELNIEKKADEEFGLGKYSLSKIASRSNQSIPVIIADKVSIKGMKDLVGMSSEISKIANEYLNRKTRYDEVLEKVAGLDLGFNAIDKLAKGYFDETINVNLEKVADDHSMALQNANKMLDGILAKSNSKAKVNPIPQIDTVKPSDDMLSKNKIDETNKLNSMFNKATKRMRTSSAKNNSTQTLNNNYSSFNLQ